MGALPCTLCIIVHHWAVLRTLNQLCHDYTAPHHITTAALTFDRQQQCILTLCNRLHSGFHLHYAMHCKMLTSLCVFCSSLSLPLPWLPTKARWLNQLNPNVKKGPFTPEEDANIMAAHAIYGNKWASIAKMLPGR